MAGPPDTGVVTYDCHGPMALGGQVDYAWLPGRPDTRDVPYHGQGGGSQGGSFAPSLRVARWCDAQ
jgi:hypothetical protein